MDERVDKKLRLDLIMEKMEEKRRKGEGESADSIVQDRIYSKY